MSLSFKPLQPRAAGLGRRALRMVANARFEVLLLILLLLTAVAVAAKDRLLLRSTSFTPANTAAMTRIVLSDSNTGGTTVAREDGVMKWTCDLRSSIAYPYCGYELFFDGNMGANGLNLTHMRSLAITMTYRGEATTFRIHLKNFDPQYSRSPNDDTAKFLRVEADTTPGQVQRVEFVPEDFGVADWWLRLHKLPPQYGRPQFDNITSMNIETGSEAPPGAHMFEVHEIAIQRAIMSDAQWYSLLLGIWIMMIVVYLGYRIGNLRRALRERQTLDALALREAQEAARHDPLTKILNRRGLTDRFTDLVKDQRGPVAIAAILIDIDHFKRLNDTHGHDYGDKVLAEVAHVIRSNVRSVDLVARWGGEEFIVVCTGIDRKGAQHLAEKIRDRIAGTDFGACGQITASFGVHWSYSAEPDLPGIVAFADVALYNAKASGRNCCKLHRIGMSKAA